VFCLLRGLEAGAQDDECLDLLDLVRVLYADDAGIENLFMAVDDVFELAGIDVVAGGDDHALDALREVDEAVLVHLAEIAGVQPDAPVVVTAERVGRFGRVVHVAEHDRGTADADFALEVGVEFLRGAGPDDLIIGVGEGHADGAHAVVVLRRETAGRHALGQAVALADLDGRAVRVQKIVHLFLELDREAVAAAEHALQAAEIGVLQFFRAQQRLEERRHAGDDVGLLFDEQVRVGLDVEARDENAARAADERGMDADAESEAVEHGHDGEHLEPRDGGEAAGRDGLQAESVEVHVAEQDALRGAGRAAGVEDGGAVVGLSVVRRERNAGSAASAQKLVPPDIGAVFGGRRVLAPRRERIAHREPGEELVLDFGHDERAGLVQPGQHGGDLLIELVEREDCLGVGKTEEEFDFARRGKRVNHVRHRADAVERVEAAQGLRAVRHADRDAVALADAERDEGLRRLVDAAHELRERGFLVHELVGGELRVLIRGRPDHLIDGLLRIRKMVRHFAVIFEPGGG